MVSVRVCVKSQSSNLNFFLSSSKILILPVILASKSVLDEVIRQLSYCVRDGLIRQVKRVGFKGKKIGVEQESYRLPKPKILVKSAA